MHTSALRIPDLMDVGPPRMMMVASVMADNTTLRCGRNRRIRDVDQVRRWRREKGMLALNFRTADGSIEVDLLVAESDGYDDLRQRAVEVTVDRRTFFVASIDDLISMKQRAGRPRDVLDIAELRNIRMRLGRT